MTKRKKVKPNQGPWLAPLGFKMADEMLSRAPLVDPYPNPLERAIAAFNQLTPRERTNFLVYCNVVTRQAEKLLGYTAAPSDLVGFQDEYPRTKAKDKKRVAEKLLKGKGGKR